MPTIAIGSSAAGRPAPAAGAAAGAAVGSAEAARSRRWPASAAGVRVVEHQRGGQPQAGGRVRRLRSSTAVSESKPRSREGPVGSTRRPRRVARARAAASARTRSTQHAGPASATQPASRSRSSPAGPGRPAVAAPGQCLAAPRAGRRSAGSAAPRGEAGANRAQSTSATTELAVVAGPARLSAAAAVDGAIGPARGGAAAAWPRRPRPARRRPTGPRPPRWRQARGPARRAPARPGTRWPPRTRPARRCPRPRRSRRTARTRRGPGRGQLVQPDRAGRLGAERLGEAPRCRASAMHSRRCRAGGVHDRAQRRCLSAGDRPRAPASAARSAMSQATTVDAAPGSASRAASSAAPGAPGRAAGQHRAAAPRPASHRATCPPIAPVPPVTRTVPRGVQASAVGTARAGAGASRRAYTRPGGSRPGPRRAAASTARSRAAGPVVERPRAGRSGRPSAPGVPAPTTRPRPQTCACTGRGQRLGRRRSRPRPGSAHHSGAAIAASPSACTSASVPARPAGRRDRGRVVGQRPSRPGRAARAPRRSAASWPPAGPPGSPCWPVWPSRWPAAVVRRGWRSPARRPPRSAGTTSNQ